MSGGSFISNAEIEAQKLLDEEAKRLLGGRRRLPVVVVEKIRREMSVTIIKLREFHRITAVEELGLSNTK